MPAPPPGRRRARTGDDDARTGEARAARGDARRRPPRSGGRPRRRPPWSTLRGAASGALEAQRAPATAGGAREARRRSGAMATAEQRSSRRNAHARRGGAHAAHDNSCLLIDKLIALYMVDADPKRGGWNMPPMQIQVERGRARRDAMSETSRRCSQEMA